MTAQLRLLPATPVQLPADLEPPGQDIYILFLLTLSPAAKGLRDFLIYK